MTQSKGMFGPLQPRRRDAAARPAVPGSRRGHRLARFRHEEDGSLLILSLFIFVIMLISTGVAIDIIRQEERRTLIQSTLDRALLAAADLNQTLKPEDVVRDYFDKSGLSYLEVTPIIKEGDYKEWRSVEATVRDTMPTLFGDLVGLESLPIKTQGRAEESIGNVEISMVLDVSGSMNDSVHTSSGTTTRIALLRSAAQDFVTTMFKTVQPPEATPGKLSISVVPYNQQVTLGTSLASRFNISTEHTKNSCVDIPRSTFGATGISNTTFLARSMYGDSFDYSGNGWSVPTNVGIENCPNNSKNTVLPLANNESTINTKIKNLVADGDTAIDYGAKWGVALLDPDAQPVVTSLIGSNLVANELAGRPFDYGEALATSGDLRSMKVLVLMTDGQNTRTYSTKMGYRTGDSPLVSTKSHNDGSDLDSNYLYYYDDTRSKPYYSFRYNKWYYASAITGDKTVIPYEKLWAKGWTLQYVIKNYLGKPLNNTSSVYAEMADQSEFSDKDTDLNKLCTAAKKSGTEILIFTVAVDAPSEGQSILEKCASAPAYAFNVTSNDMKTAFASIASAINALRLTN